MTDLPGTAPATKAQSRAALDSLTTTLDSIVEISVRLVGAERGSVFLHDPDTDELFTRVALGVDGREIRLAADTGIVGAVFRSGQTEIIADTAADPRHRADIDTELNFKSTSLLCVPLRTKDGVTVGVVQCINKIDGAFTMSDQRALEDLSQFCAATLRSLKLVEDLETVRQREADFMGVISDITSEIDLESLLEKVIAEICRMLNAERATIFLNDAATGELFSIIGKGLAAQEIRLPNTMGIAGSVFTSERLINIPHAYADLRFNPSFDRATGFFTRSILCLPIVNKNGQVIGVTQALNKLSGPFSEQDEQRLRAFSAQISIGLENAKLFRDVQDVRNYNQSMLQSMANLVLSIDDQGKIKSANAACQRILGVAPDALTGKTMAEVSDGSVLQDRIDRVMTTGHPQELVDTELTLLDKVITANVTITPLTSLDDSSLGLILMIEDISTEKRIRATMARYVDPDLTERLLAGDQRDNVLGGTEARATVLFSDIRGFTTITETLGPQGTVAMLNQYFERMVTCVSENGGVLDKFIGDAIMAAFGVPEPQEDDEDRALRTSIQMIRRLNDWNQERQTNGEAPIKIGIGLNSEPVVAGNIGSQKRMDYTIIGDGVNLAARLESACKFYRATILLSEFTAARLKGAYRLRELDRVVVKGKVNPVGVYEALDFHTPESFPNAMEVIGHFSDGLTQYKAQNWRAAIKDFGAAQRAHPDDYASAMYLQRCETLMQSPPADGWDGVFVMQDK